ncbi:acyl-CoA dehydrogenase family protein [Actinomyces minihominis]|uniref:acyl-CoA dehydrogenase family protein n=1 Tax=Actinomyces minihominis TaxID=2002838 RepID=UPI000C071B15|nr:acyl-CoA dehydrogenase family protein [Actinomyces minihominis]
MSFLSDELLAQIHSRAAQYDAENVFPQEDYDELRDAGYLAAFVPKQYGGAGLSLNEIAAEQTRLAKAAPGTALGINMHQIIVGLGRYLVRAGLAQGEQILRDAADGHLFGFGISEPGNDLVLFGSITEARPDGEGGYTFYGTKVFTSLSPAWTRLLTFGSDTTSEDAPKSVFAILHRDRGGVDIKDDWHVLGMRATQSNTTVLNAAPAGASQVLGRITPGPSLDPVILGIFAHFEILLAATYTGVGLRAIEVAVEHVKKRRSLMNQTVYANDPAIRWRLAEAALLMDAVGPQIRELATLVESDEKPSLAWLPRFSAVKNAASEASLRSVEQCIRACGGSSYYDKNELSRLYRDVLAGLFQPSDQESLHGAWANMLLGPIEK